MILMWPIYMDINLDLPYTSAVFNFSILYA